MGIEQYLISSPQKYSEIQQKAFEVIIANLSEKVSDNVSLDMDFNSIGLNSITFIKTIVALECEFDFEFDDEMLLITKFPTVKSMVEYVESKTTTNFENA
jgi:acyl carrier protein